MDRLTQSGVLFRSGAAMRPLKSKVRIRDFTSSILAPTLRVTLDRSDAASMIVELEQVYANSPHHAVQTEYSL